jgi:hypothetical protein
VDLTPNVDFTLAVAGGGCGVRENRGVSVSDGEVFLTVSATAKQPSIQVTRLRAGGARAAEPPGRSSGGGPGLAARVRRRERQHNVCPLSITFVPQ